MNIHFKPETFRMTIRKASYDDAKKQYLVDSDLQVYNFDDVKEYVCRKLRDNSFTRSCDAYYQDRKGREYLIEFKNQREEDVPRRMLRQKAYDSLFLHLLTFGRGKTVDEASQNMSLIVVYNNDAASGPPERRYSKSESFEKMAAAFGSFAGEQRPRSVKFGLSYLRGQLYREVDTLDVRDFMREFVNGKFCE